VRITSGTSTSILSSSQTFRRAPEMVFRTTLATPAVKPVDHDGGMSLETAAQTK